ncbi:UNVERIFIED_CONTAM: hypothetical protein PYX00_004776 [Menopon gallinae]|uniref:G-protein coupled receptors family 1 profile domain-containing protein n=1 Tax=Menopon gallinae TaxID=328185 RepID=A0AAW2I7S9_9NEOP
MSGTREPGAVDDAVRNFTEPSHILNNVTWWYMKESQEIDSNILKLYELNRKVDGSAYYCLIIAYSLLIFLGSCGNILVVCVIIRKPAMRTARNMFILNLAISDLLLCLVTMPLTLMEILTRYWPLGHNSFFCKIIGTSQAISIYVSTLSITAIALDRYQVIVYPTRDSLHRFGAIMILGGIWLSSTILASPMYFCRKLEIHYNISLPQIGIDSIAYCLEDWSVKHGRAYYSIFVLVIQYVLPIIIVSVAYTRICKKLQYRYVSTTVVKKDNELSRRKSREDRRRKTNSLLIAIALVYCISWLPLDICNVILDFSNPFGEDYHTTMVVYAVCHMMGMSSACSNPLLYGWLNDNFRKEFKEILALVCPCARSNTVRDRFTSLRSSVSKRKKSKSSGRSFEKIGMKVKSANEPEEKSSFLNESRSKEDVATKERSTNVTEVMNTSIENYYLDEEIDLKIETL